MICAVVGLVVSSREVLRRPRLHHRHFVSRRHQVYGVFTHCCIDWTDCILCLLVVDFNSTSTVDVRGYHFELAILPMFTKTSHKELGN